MNITFALRAKIISDVTDRNRPTIFFRKTMKPRICPTEFFNFNSRYLENENEFFKNSFETVFRASKSRDRGQLVSVFQLTFKIHLLKCGIPLCLFKRLFSGVIFVREGLCTGELVFGRTLKNIENLNKSMYRLPVRETGPANNMTRCSGRSKCSLPHASTHPS